MATEKSKLVRVTGGLTGDLGGVGLTERGTAFDCPKDLAEQLLKDGTGRWARPGTPEAVAAAEEVAGMKAAAKRLEEEARQKAEATKAPPGKAAKPRGGDA